MKLEVRPNIMELCRFYLTQDILCLCHRHQTVNASQHNCENNTKYAKYTLHLKCRCMSTFGSLRLTLCTASFNIQKFCVLPTRHLCVLCGSQNKQRLFLYTALTYRFLNRSRECLLRGTDWVFNSDRYSFVLKGLK